jgi:hypothetical protein
LHETLASIGRNILRLIRVSLKNERKVWLCASSFLRALSLPPVFAFVAPVPEVTRASEVGVATKAAHIMVALSAKTSAQEAAAAWDATAIHVKDVKDRGALEEKEAQERVSRVEVENTAVLASAHEDVEGLL